MSRLQRFLSYAGQVVLYTAFAAFIAVFSGWPVYRHLPPDHALIRLSLIHHGQRVHECKPVSAEELAALQPNMRALTKCPRERAPVTVEVDIDGTLAYREMVAPTGLSGDGPSAIYQRLTVPAGVHQLSVRLRDSTRADGFDVERSSTVDLAPEKILVVDFNAENRAITFR